MLIRLTARSLGNRRSSVVLTIASIAIAVMLLLAVERLRTETRNSFLNTVAGTDLIAGARSGSVQLLLYSVFRMGSVTSNVSWDAYRRISAHPYVEWSIPLSLGDSHRGFPVLGTSDDYFRHLRYGRDQALEIAAGSNALDLHTAVLGSSVAAQLGYQPGDRLVVAHGSGAGSFAKHDDRPFTVSGVLEPTGTPVDRTIHVSLASLDAIHIGWESGIRQPQSAGPAPGDPVPGDTAPRLDRDPEQITAFLLGMKQRMHTFQIQRAINAYPQEPLMAILPGVALQELWTLVGAAERALLAVSMLVVLAGLMGMMTVILSGLNERRREMAILRSVGARPVHVFALLVGESTLIGTAGAVSGLVLLYLLLLAAAPWLGSAYGLHLEIGWPSATEFALLGTVVVLALLLGLIPAWRGYRQSLADGLTIRL